MAGGMYYLVKIGALTPKSSYGAMPAIVFTGLVGCLVGSISAKIMCIKKVMDLPSSTLRAQFEARRTQAAYGGLMYVFGTNRFPLNFHRQIINTSMYQHISMFQYDY